MAMDLSKQDALALLDHLLSQEEVEELDLVVRARLLAGITTSSAAGVEQVEVRSRRNLTRACEYSAPLRGGLLCSI